MTLENLKQKIQQDMIAAMRAQEKDRLGTIRMLMAAIKQFEIDNQTSLDNGGVVKIVEKMIKQRRESIKQYEAGNRPELAKKEQEEINLLQTYLPPAMSEAEVNAVIDEAIQHTGASSLKDMGKVMAAIKDKLQGRVDMGSVGAKIRSRLN